MSRRRPCDGDSSRREGLPSVCEPIGEQLGATRATRQVSVEEISARLMLSKSQILGLEKADATAFYSPAYFIKALRRYMEFLGIPTDVLDEADQDDTLGGLRMTLAEPEPPPAFNWWPWPRPHKTST